MAAETITASSSQDFPITAEIDRSDPGRPAIRLECGCNEFWLDAPEARALMEYLQRTVPVLETKDGG